MMETGVPGENHRPSLCHLSSPPGFGGVRVARSFALGVVFYRLLFILLFFFFWPLCCLSFSDLRIMIIHLWYLQTISTDNLLT